MFSHSESTCEFDRLIEELRNLIMVAIICTNYLRCFKTLGKEDIIEQSVTNSYGSVCDEKDFEDFLVLVLNIVV